MSAIDINANKNDLEDLITLWSESFGDAREIPQRFYSRFDCEKGTFVLRKNNEVISCVNAIKVYFGEKTGYYFYAVSTKQSFRRQGLMESLLCLSEKYLAEIGAEFFCLIPADEKLANYYKNLGYKIAVDKTKEKFDENKFKDYSEIPADKFIELRRKNKNLLSFDDETLKILAKDFLFYGGRILGNKEDYVLVSENGTIEEASFPAKSSSLPLLLKPKSGFDLSAPDLKTGIIFD